MIFSWKLNQNANCATSMTALSLAMVTYDAYLTMRAHGVMVCRAAHHHNWNAMQYTHKSHIDENLNHNQSQITSTIQNLKSNKINHIIKHL